MINGRIQLLPVLALAALVTQVRAETKTVMRRLDVDEPRRIVFHDDDDDGVREPVTYLGVETEPASRALSAQLGLTKGTGLVVANVLDKSPASDVLKDDDVLTRFEDQILIDTHQLGVLVRSKKEGDEVKLTLVRAGKEMTVKVKLGKREAPKHANTFFFRHIGDGDGGIDLPLLPEGHGAVAWRALPGMGPDDTKDVLHMIEHERGNFLVGPGVRIVSRGGKGSTIVDLPKSNISYSDDEGSLEIKVDDGKRNLTAKNAKGEVIFNGPINTAEERAKLPPEVGKQVSKLENDNFNVEMGEDFHPETVPLLPGPERTKIGHQFPPGAGRPASSSSGPF